MPHPGRVISCGSPYGQGGLGQHFAQLVEETREDDLLVRYYSPRPRPGDDEIGCAVPLPLFRLISRYTPARFSAPLRSHLKGELFDRRVAAALAPPSEAFMGFVGKALHSFHRAYDLGFERLELVAANPHVNVVRRQHARAYRDTGLQDTWLGKAQWRKTLREYEMADLIYVHSTYTLNSFLRQGIPADKLRRTHLQVDPRFVPRHRPSADGVFRVIYVGRLEATKGIPLLLQAFAALPVPRKELTLVGGWSSRSMRRLVQRWQARDGRIRVAPGDPLPALQQADVFVHPTYEDGFGYAPMEALACGVPVVVTEDTGMKEYVREGQNGYIVPTGSWQALLERMEHLHRYPLKPSAPTSQQALPALA